MKKSTHITFNGKTQSQSAWAKELKITRSTLQWRKQNGFSDYECLFGKSIIHKTKSEKRESHLLAMRKWTKKNPEKVKKSQKKWTINNKDKIKEKSLKYKYGITLKQYNDLLCKQNNKCAICSGENGKNNTWGKSRLSVDHNHKTNEIRGLLCGSCNRAIGLLQENPKIILEAYHYMSSQTSLSRLSATTQIQHENG